MESNPVMKILVIDDEQDIREGCVRVLKRIKGCEVTSAPNGTAGLEIFRKEFFAVVLTDLKMPGIDGMEVLREIEAMEQGTLVIVITGFATVETAIEAMKQGAYDFIPKPFDPTQLRMVVTRALDKIRLEQEAQRLADERLRTLVDLDTEKSRISAIVESLPNGVVVTDASGKVVLMNPAFKDISIQKEASVPGSDIAEYIADEGFCDIVREISQCQRENKNEVATYELETAGGKYLIARGRPILNEIGDCLGGVQQLSEVAVYAAVLILA